MKVALFGGTGFVGSYLVDELLRQGHHPVLLVRPGNHGKVVQAAKCTLVQGDIADEAAIRKTLQDAHAIIYNIGILREYPGRGVTYRALHYEGVRRVVDQAEAAGVKRFVLMSANGVKADGTGYQRTKFMAEQYLAGSGLEWTVFRPSVLFGDPRGRMEFATQLYQDVIRSPLPAPLFFPGLLPVDAGQFRMAPIHVRDVATMFVKSLDMQHTAGRIFALGGAEAITWKDILRTIAQATGGSQWALPAPVLLVKGLATLLDQFAFFPVTRDQLTMLMEGNTCDGQPAFDTFAVEPSPFNPDSLSYLKPVA